MRVSVVFGRSAVGRPACVADADRAGERLARQSGFEITQLALGTSARKLGTFQRGDAGGVITSVLQPLERVDKQARNRLTQPSLTTCRPRPSASAAAGTS